MRYGLSILLCACSFNHSFIQQLLDTNYVPIPVPRAGEEARGGLEGPRPARLLERSSAEGGVGGFWYSLFLVLPKHRAWEWDVSVFAYPFFVHLFICRVT